MGQPSLQPLPVAVVQTTAVFLLLSSLLSFLGRAASARAMAVKMEDHFKTKDFFTILNKKSQKYHFLGKGRRGRLPLGEAFRLLSPSSS